MNQDNKPIQNNIDSKSVQPEVLGQLRSEKIGNPSMLIAIAAIITIVLLLLPIGSAMLQNPNSPLYKLIYGVQEEVEDDKVNEFEDGTVIHELRTDTVLKVGNLVIKNFVLGNGEVNCEIYSYNGILDLDNSDYYLNIYSSPEEKDLVGYVKIIGKDYDSTSTPVTLYNQTLKFNTTHTYYGKVVKKNSEADYDAYNVNSDESGIGSITCKRNTREIEYVFENNYLIQINDSVREKVRNYKSEEYLSLLKTYQNKASILGSVASVTEEEEGFTYLAKLNMKSYKLPDNLNDTNYYKENTLAKVIIYSEIGKGYDCK
jgi:hypothetical protein